MAYNCVLVRLSEDLLAQLQDMNVTYSAFTKMSRQYVSPRMIFQHVPLTCPQVRAIIHDVFFSMIPAG